ncbi:MAG: hypothetical protein AAFV33_01785 [Chloroflexota bacterium]
MWLYVLLALVFAGGLVLIFARDWVWSIDSRSEEFERDENGDPIRTAAWDRNHLLAGIVMVVVAIVLAGALALQ